MPETRYEKRLKAYENNYTTVFGRNRTFESGKCSG